MNSYNENLQASVVASLSAQELDLTNASAQLDASMFSLYYAQGARITAAEKLSATTDQYTDERILQQTAVENNNIAVNLVDAANQSKDYTAQSINNIAVGAANIQVAANAILLLASDVGGILNIASAADFDTQIYKQASEASAYMTDTAYEAELASQYAMEASNLTAQVSSSTVADQATATGTAMQTMLDTLTAQFNATASAMATDTTALQTASDSEKKAEGQLEDLNVEYYATQSAYNLTNLELNLDIRVPDGAYRGADKESIAYKTNTYYTVCFDPLKSAYPPLKEQQPGYPVENYYLFLVPYDQSGTFTITSAEALIQDGENSSFFKLDALPPDGASKFKQKIFISELDDIQGSELVVGDEYTIFVYGKLAEYYQKTLNNFDEFLSAPSAEFCIINELNAPLGDTFKTSPQAMVSDQKSGGDEEVVNADPTEPVKDLTFEVLQDSNFINEVEYRLYLLPDQCDLVQGLLTDAALRKQEREVERMERIADKYDPEIAELDQKETSLQASISSLDEQKKELRQEINNTPVGDDKTALEKQLAQTNKDLAAARQSLRTTKQDLRKVEIKKKAAQSTIDPNFHSKPGFFFNTILAEQVPAGSYTVVQKLKTVNAGHGMKKVTGTVKFKDDMTDNFGNPLVTETKYVPAILTVIKDSNPNPDQFVSALSDFANTGHFTYIQ